MEGFDNEWISAGSKKDVTYTNLDPGEYTFKVKASNNDGIWNNAGTSIKLIIPSPPWLSWYAYCFYTSLFLGVILFIIKYRVKEATREIETQAKIERAKLEEREEVRKKSSADFHDEAGNKLTRINLFTQLAKTASDNNAELKVYLNKIEENTKELSSGMRDFIWVLDPSKDSLFDTINRLKDFGNSMFGYTEIKFAVKGLTAEMSDTSLSIECRRALILIFKEAMNNALKYSCAKNVELCISYSNKIIEVTLTDDGIGFDINDKTDGYGLNNMKNRAAKINSDLEIFSTPNTGAKIIFRINIAHMSD
jgi:signal transduction histidine kinase